MATQDRAFADRSPGVRAAIANNFDGDVQLYLAFASSCFEQFAHDLSSGEAVCDAGDLPALRRLAHDLKSALVMLGHDAPFAVAQKLEHHQKEVGYGKIIAMMQFGTLPHDLTKRSMELFARKVMPKIRHIGANSAPVVVEAAE